MTQPRVFNGQDINVAAAAARGVLDQLLAEEDLDFARYVTLRSLVNGAEPPAGYAEDALPRLASDGLTTPSGEPTPRGREIIERVTAASARTGDLLFADIPHDDLETTRRVLNLVTERANAVRAERQAG
jgi:hypothetical protein